eukprot:16831_1
MGDVEALKYVLFNKRIQSDNDKCKSLAQLFVTRIPSNFSDTLEALMNGANDVQILNNFSMIFGIYRRNDQVVFQHKAFNYFTLKTSLDDDTEFKVVDDTKDNGSSGGLYSFGLGDHGRLGLGGKGVRAEPTLCATLMKSNITKISCYFAHSLCIDVNGCAYSWGDNEFGQLGLGDCENRNTPQILDALTPYNALSAVVGRAHSLILTDEGNVWSCGKSVYGTLGYVSKDNVLSPKRIETLNNEHIVHISCGWDHSCLISKDGKLFTFGNNEYGQCGVGKDNKKIFVPTNVVFADGLIPEFTACGDDHTLILTTTHMVMSCGWGYSYQLGDGIEHKIPAFGKMETGHYQTNPKIIEALKTKHIVNIASGKSHSLCVSKDGAVYTFGHGEYGQLGHGNKEAQLIPKEVQFFKDKNIKIRECVSGTSHSGAISMNGDIYLFGYGYYGELGQGPDDKENKMIPIKVEYFNNIAVKCMSLGNSC